MSGLSRRESTTDRLVSFVIILVIAAVQLTLPPSVTVGPLWLLPLLEVLVIPSSLILDRRTRMSPGTVRINTTVLFVILVSSSVTNATLQFITMFSPVDETGQNLLLAGLKVLAVCILSFGILYWRLDGGGSAAVDTPSGTRMHFLFPQQSMSGSTWRPRLGDYLYIAFTNTIAFSPTDTMPLTAAAKSLFTVQSAVALMTILVTLSRAINFLPG